MAHTWRTERWDSLRLLTPNWQSRLPGFGYRGPDPDGYRTLPEVIDFIAAYAEAIRAPVCETRTTVTSVRRAETGYLVRTDQGTGRAEQSLVIASGAFNIACIPGVANRVPRSVTTLTTQQYRNPDQLAAGGVLVVGASSSGTQIASEIHIARRPVTLSVGEHIWSAPGCIGAKRHSSGGWNMPQCILDERYRTRSTTSRGRGACRRCSLPARPIARRSTSTLSPRIGVRLVGRLAGITESGKAQFAGSLRNMCALSGSQDEPPPEPDRPMGASGNGFDGTVEPPHRALPPTEVEQAPPLALDFAGGEIHDDHLGHRLSPRLFLARASRSSIARGMVRHDGGVVASFKACMFDGRPSSCVAENPHRSMALATTPATSVIIWRPASTARCCGRPDGLIPTAPVTVILRCPRSCAGLEGWSRVPACWHPSRLASLAPPAMSAIALTRG